MGAELPTVDAERIYLSDVEPHAAAPIDRASDLRSRVLLHVLFADVLLVGDSQSLNNKYFRALVSSSEAENVQWADGVKLPDLAQLIEAGRLRVALREGRTLEEIRDEHERRKVDNVPRPAYAEQLTRLSAAHPVSYDGAAVAVGFKAGALARIDAARQDSTSGTRTALDDAHGWIKDQWPFDYNALRAWLDGYREEHPGGSAELILALQSVDEWVGESYRRSLPEVLGVGLAGPQDGSGTIPAVRSRRLAEGTELPAVMLDNLLLSQLPVDVLLEAVEQPSRNALVGELGRLRRGSQPDVPVLREAVGEFSEWMLDAFHRTFRRTGGRAWEHLQSRNRLMRFGLDEDQVTGRLGASLEVRGAPSGEDGNLSFQVVNQPGEAEPGVEGRVPASQRRLDPRARMVTS